MLSINAASIKPYLAICRISNLPSVWTNVLCAYLLTVNGFSWQEYIFPALSMSCLYVAGMCLNDLCDAAYDGRHRPDRPIPSGAISRFEAFLFTLALMLTALILLANEHLEGLYSAFLLIAAIVWYDLRHKNNPYSVLLMAACRFLVFMVTSLSVSGNVPVTVLIAGSVHFAYVVCLSLVARYESGRSIPLSLPVIPLMLAAIPLIDGMILALLVKPFWLLAGLGAAMLMQEGQKYVRGD